MDKTLRVQQKQLWISLSAVVGLAMGALALWLTELVWKSGWDQFSWLWGAQRSIFGINLFAVLAYLIPVGVLRRMSWKQLWMPGLELYFVGIIAFFITKSILYSLFMPLPVFQLSPLILWLMLATLVLTTAGSFYYLTNNHLYPVRTAFVPLMVGVELIAGIFSMLFTYLIWRPPAPDMLLILAVKTGLPFFFITLLLGLFSILSLRKLAVQKNDDREDEILDDIML